MRYKLLDGPYGNCVFQFQKKEAYIPANIWYVGWERQTKASYRWNGETRTDSENTFIFQYTTKGKGAIRVGEAVYSLPKGKAFLVKVPGDHEYWLPEGSAEWEFLFITLVGESTESCWAEFAYRNGPVAAIPEESELVRLLKQINQEALNDEISDKYIASCKAYNFVMALHRYGKGLTEAEDKLPEHMKKAVRLIEKKLGEPLSLTDLAEEAGLSKYYFIQLFQQYFHETPIQYMTKKRMERSMERLSNSDLPIKEIANLSGYESANYFSKVFKKEIGESPKEFRGRTRDRQFTRVFLE